MNIGSLIKERRTALSLTQKDLSDKLNISIQRLNNFENESRIPPLEMIDLIARELDFNIDRPKKKYDYSYIFKIELFKEKIKTYRINNKLTLLDLSKKLNISRQTLSKYECGEALPNINLYYEICSKLKIKPSSLICEYKKNKTNHIKLKHLISFVFIFIIIFILIKICNLVSLNSNQITSSNNSINSVTNSYISSTRITNSNSYYEIIDSTSSIENSIKISSYQVMSESTIDLINESNNNYLNNKYASIDRPYTLHFNDNNIDDIPFYYGEKVRLPLFFDDEKFVSHYESVNSIYFSEIDLFNENDFYLTPYYVTYEEYINSLKISYIDNYYHLTFNSLSLCTIIPEHINGIDNFKISDFYCGNIIIFNNSNSIIEIDKIDLPIQEFYINSKNISFSINTKSTFDINIIAINQTNNYSKTSDFISNGKISYFYLSSDNIYDNFINFYNDIDYLYLATPFAKNNKNFIHGNINYSFEQEINAQYLYYKAINGHVKKRLTIY